MAVAVAQPYFYRGGSTGVLLIHGFMGLPNELRSLADALAARNYTVAVPLLARHGQRPEAMVGVRWAEWYGSVEDVYHKLRAQSERVVVIGYSLGGLLGLHLAARQSVAGVVTLAGALQLAGGWPLRTLPLARYVMPWFYPLRFANFADPQVRTSIIEKAGEINWDDPTTIAYLRTSVCISTGAIYEIARLGGVVRRELPAITVPALILQGRRDQTVEPRSAELITAGLGSRDKELQWFVHSDHMLPNGVEREAMQHAVDQWLAARFPVAHLSAV